MRLRRCARIARRLADNERRALELHDNIVQGLTAIHWALEAQDYDRARTATRETLEYAQKMIGDQLDEDAFAPGTLRRDSGAGG